MEQVTLWASSTKARAPQLSWPAPICYNLDYQLMWGGNEVAAGGEILISSFIKQIWPDKLSAGLNCSVIDRVMLFSSSIVFRASFCFLIDCFNVQITFYCIAMGNYKLIFISHGDESRILKIPKPCIIVSAWFNFTIECSHAVYKTPTMILVLLWSFHDITTKKTFPFLHPKHPKGKVFLYVGDCLHTTNSPSPLLSNSWKQIKFSISS